LPGLRTTSQSYQIDCSQGQGLTAGPSQYQAHTENYSVVIFWLDYIMSEW